MNKKAFRAVLAAAAISVLATTVATVSPAQAAANACAGVGTYAKQPGKTVEIMNSVIGQENARYQAALIAFQNCTGITINWNGNNDF